MDVRRQTCQSCDSIDVRNIIVRDGDGGQTIFVRCANCKELVARYHLKDYYHHGKGIESYLRSHGHRHSESARQWTKDFEKSQEDAVVGYQEALTFLADRNKDV